MPNPDLVDITRDHAIHKLGGILASDQILVKRRDVDKGGSVADGIVLVLMMHFIYADGVVSRPLAIIQALTERKSSLVERGSNGHRNLPLTINRQRQRTITGFKNGITR